MGDNLINTAIALSLLKEITSEGRELKERNNGNECVGDRGRMP